MSFQFVNNWPYSDTVFPTMDEHTDPVNNAYFAGLMTELGRMEYYLGINPQGPCKDVAERLNNLRSDLGINPQEGFDDVKDKLEEHGHTGGTDGKLLTVPVPGVWEGVDFVGTIESFTVDPSNVGSSYAGFAYYNFVYLGPCEADAGPRKIRSFNTLNDETFWQDSIVALQPRGAIWTGQHGIFSLGGSPGHILRFNPLTWEQIDTTLDTGDNFPNQLIEQDSNIWTPTSTSPTRIVRYTPNTHAHAAWEMDTGENDCKAVCTDGTYIWTCCNTDPVRLIRFKISDKTHTAFFLNGLLPEIIYMVYYDGMVYMYSNNAVVQWARFNPDTLAWQRFEPEFPHPFKAGTLWDNKIALMLSNGSNAYMALTIPNELTFWLSRDLGSTGPAIWLTIASDHAVWPGSTAENVDWEAPLTDPT